MLSNNPNLHLLSPSLICDCKTELSLCINYSFFARSSRGPEDMGNYSLCQWSGWTPADKEHCWWRHGAHNPPSKTATLILSCLFPLPSFPFSSLFSFLPSWMSKGVRKKEYVFLFLLSQWAAPKDTAIIIPSLFLPKASLTGDFCLTLLSRKSHLIPSVWWKQKKKKLIQERTEKETSRNQGGKELKYSRLLLSCHAAFLIRSISVLAEVNLPLTAPTQQSISLTFD